MGPASGEHAANLIEAAHGGAEERSEVGWIRLTSFYFHLAAEIRESNGAHLEGTALDGVGFLPDHRIVGGVHGASESFETPGGVRLKNLDQLLHQCGLSAFLQLPESGGQDPRVGNVAAGVTFDCLIKLHIGFSPGGHIGRH